LRILFENLAKLHSLKHAIYKFTDTRNAIAEGIKLTFEWWLSEVDNGFRSSALDFGFNCQSCR
jgi:hypothetical protein